MTALPVYHKCTYLPLSSLNHLKKIILNTLWYTYHNDYIGSIFMTPLEVVVHVSKELQDKTAPPQDAAAPLYDPLRTGTTQNSVPPTQVIPLSECRWVRLNNPTSCTAEKDHWETQFLFRKATGILEQQTPRTQQVDEGSSSAVSQETKSSSATCLCEPHRRWQKSPPLKESRMILLQAVEGGVRRCRSHC